MKNIFTKIYLLLFLMCFTILEANSQSVGGTISGATAVCPNSPNSGFLQLLGYTGTILNWESTTDGGITWNNIGNPINSYSYSNITQTTCYRVIVKDGAFPPDTSSIACITIIPPSVGGTISGGGIFCDSSGIGTLYLTGDTGNVLYWQYSTDSGATWITVNDTTDTLIFSNITQNTIYWAVVQNGTGCPADTSSQLFFTIDSVTVAGNISGSDTVCYGVNAGTLSLSGNVGTILSWIYSTDNGVSWTVLSNTTSNQNYSGLIQTTLFAAIVQSGTCNIDTAFSIITVRIPVPVDAGNDTTIMQGQSFTLNGFGNGTAIWSPSTGLNNDTLFTPIATPTVTTSYILTVTDTYGCVNTDTIMITVKLLGEFSGMITNLFTPNGDEINDTWYIQNIQEFPDNEVFIYNIYGNEVYHKKNYTNDWKGTYNGSDLPDGTYYYVLKFDDSQKVLKGSLDILNSK